MNNRFALEQGGGLQILQLAYSWDCRWVNGYQERELIQINRYDNDYEYWNTKGSNTFPTHYEEDSNDYISMISRKPTPK
jgi:hypothetical protein